MAVNTGFTQIIIALVTCKYKFGYMRRAEPVVTIVTEHAASVAQNQRTGIKNASVTQRRMIVAKISVAQIASTLTVGAKLNMA